MVIQLRHHHVGPMARPDEVLVEGFCRRGDEATEALVGRGAKIDTFRGAAAFGSQVYRVITNAA